MSVGGEGGGGHGSELPSDNLDDDQPALPISEPTTSDIELTRMHYDWLKAFTRFQLMVLWSLIFFVLAIMLTDWLRGYVDIRYYLGLTDEQRKLLEGHNFLGLSWNVKDIVTLTLPIFAFLVGMSSSSSPKK